MAIKLYRCSTMWLKIGGHPCWKVQKSLDEQGIEYEVVKGPLSRGKRDELERLSGQRKYPVIEFEDGSFYRAESRDMAETIRQGKLFERQAQAAPAPDGQGDAPPATEPPSAPPAGAAPAG
jgi:glutathione S-transferase